MRKSAGGFIWNYSPWKDLDDDINDDYEELEFIDDFTPKGVTLNFGVRAEN